LSGRVRVDFCFDGEVFRRNIADDEINVARLPLRLVTDIVLWSAYPSGNSCAKS